MEGSDPAGRRYAASGCRESNFEEAIAGAMAAGLRGDRGERRETCLVICEPNFHESHRQRRKEKSNQRRGCLISCRGHGRRRRENKRIWVVYWLSANG
jgi:hypothetical protein